MTHAKLGNTSQHSGPKKPRSKAGGVSNLVKEQLSEFSETHFESIMRQYDQERETDPKLQYITKSDVLSRLDSAVNKPVDSFSPFKNNNYAKLPKKFADHLMLINLSTNSEEYAHRHIESYPFSMMVDGRLSQRIKPEQVGESIRTYQNIIKASFNGFIDKQKKEEMDRLFDNSSVSDSSISNNSSEKSRNSKSSRISKSNNDSLNIQSSRGLHNNVSQQSRSRSPSIPREINAPALLRNLSSKSLQSLQSLRTNVQHRSNSPNDVSSTGGRGSHLSKVINRSDQNRHSGKSF